jgi:Ala-tRNA(Pro) deacylase
MDALQFDEVAHGSRTGPSGRLQQSQFAQLVSLFGTSRCRFSIIEHDPIGETVAATRARGHSLASSAKTIVATFRMTNRGADALALLVVPGDTKVDFDGAKTALGCKRVAFATRAQAEHAMRTVSGSIPPVPPGREVPVVIDTRLLTEDFLVFNASRLDISIKIATHDYIRVVNPIVADIGLAIEPDRTTPSDSRMRGPLCLRHS